MRVTRDSADIVRISDGLLRLVQVLGAITNASAGVQGLSQLQLEILTLLAGRGTAETVGFFARRFRISDATVSDSLRVLESKGLVTKLRGHDDRRAVYVAITDAGREMVMRANVWTEKLRRIVSGWDEHRRAQVLPAVIELIEGLQKEGMIPVDRMCAACRYFAINCDTDSGSAPFFCRFIDAPLRTLDLRVDCPDFESQPQS